MRTSLSHAVVLTVALTASGWPTSLVAAPEAVRSSGPLPAYDNTDYEQLAQEEAQQYLQDRQAVLHMLLHQKRLSALHL